MELRERKEREALVRNRFLPESLPEQFRGPILAVLSQMGPPPEPDAQREKI